MTVASKIIPTSDPQGEVWKVFSFPRRRSVFMDFNLKISKQSEAGQGNLNALFRARFDHHGSWPKHFTQGCASRGGFERLQSFAVGQVQDQGLVNPAFTAFFFPAFQQLYQGW